MNRILSLCSVVIGLGVVMISMSWAVSGDKSEEILITGSVTTLEGSDSSKVRIYARTSSSKGVVTKNVWVDTDGKYSVSITRGDELSISYLSAEGQNTVSDLSGNADQQIHVRLRPYLASAGRPFDIGTFARQSTALKLMYMNADRTDNDERRKLFAQLDVNLNGLIARAEPAATKVNEQQVQEIIRSELESIKKVQEAAKSNKFGREMLEP